MKKIYFKIVLSLLIFTPLACEMSLEELNEDPNNPTAANLDLVFTAGENSVLYKFGRFTNGSDWDLWAGLWTQTFAGNHGSGISFDQYQIRNADAVWTTWYDGMGDLKNVIDRGETLEAWHHVGVSQIVTALALGNLTSFYGDIPYSESFQGVNLSQPKMDTQEEIYTTIFTLLSNGITNLQKTPQIPLGTADFVFEGDAAKWIGVAYALEARYRNHFSVKDAAGSATQALTAITNAKTNGFTSSSADLAFPYAGVGVYQNGYFHLFENNQIIASENFMNLLDNTSDPRKEAFWNDENTDGVSVGYVGKKNGFGTSAVSYSPIGPKGYYGKADSKQLIVSHFELLFIEAEAKFRSNDKAGAATALNAAIEAHLDQVTPSYIATLTAAGSSVTAYQQKVTDYKANNANETSATITIEKIMSEKHKAMVCMNGESWVDVRRHDYQYPSYLEIPEFANGTPVASDFIQRVLYPQESIVGNPNTPSNVTIFDQLWIFQP